MSARRSVSGFKSVDEESVLCRLASCEAACERVAAPEEEEEADSLAFFFLLASKGVEDGILKARV